MKDIVRPEILEEFGVEMIGMALSNLLEGAFWDSIKDDSTNHENHEKQKKLIMKLLKNGILSIGGIMKRALLILLLLGKPGIRPDSRPWT